MKFGKVNVTFWRLLTIGIKTHRIKSKDLSKNVTSLFTVVIWNSQEIYSWLHTDIFLLSCITPLDRKEPMQ